MFQNNIEINVPALTHDEADAVAHSLSHDEACSAVGRWAFDSDNTDLEFLESVKNLLQQVRPQSVHERLGTLRGAIKRAAANPAMTPAERWTRIRSIYSDFRHDVLSDRAEVRQLVIRRRRRQQQQQRRGEALQLRADARELRAKLQDERGLLLEAVRQLNELREAQGLDTMEIRDNDLVISQPEAEAEDLADMFAEPF